MSKKNSRTNLKIQSRKESQNYMNPIIEIPDNTNDSFESSSSNDDIETRLKRLMIVKKQQTAEKLCQGNFRSQTVTSEQNNINFLKRGSGKIPKIKSRKAEDTKEFEISKETLKKRINLRKSTITKTNDKTQQNLCGQENEGDNIQLEENSENDQDSNKQNKPNNYIDGYDDSEGEENKNNDDDNNEEKQKTKLLEYDLFYKELFFKNEVFKFDPKFKDKEEDEINKDIMKLNLKNNIKETKKLKDIEEAKGRNTTEIDKKLKELQYEYDKIKNAKEVKAELSMNNTEGYLAKGIILDNYFNESSNPIIPKYTVENERDVKGKEIIDFKDVSNEELVRRFWDPCCCLKQRKKCYKFRVYAKYYCGYIVDNFIFDNLSLLVIILNTIFIIISDPRADDSLSNNSDSYFLYFYTVECILKIIGFGFIFSERAYLKDYWNILDFLVIIVGWVSFIIERIFKGNKISGMSALRAFRILRPLKTVKSIKGLRRLIIALLGSLAKLKDITIVLFFFFLLFAIGGVQMWQGNFLRRCMSVNYGYMYSLTGSKAMCTFDSDCDEFDEPGNVFICSKGWKNPNNGATSFDSTLVGFVTIFIIATMEGWSEIFEFVSLTFKDKIYINPIINFLFFHFFIFACGFYLMNLFLAVTNTEFTNIERVRKELTAKKSFYELMKVNYDLQEKIKIDKKRKEKEKGDKKNKKLGENIYDLKEKVQDDAFYIVKNIKDVPKTYITIKDIYILSGNSPQEIYKIEESIDKEQDYLYDDIDRQMDEIDKMAEETKEEELEEDSEKLISEEALKQKKQLYDEEIKKNNLLIDFGIKGGHDYSNNLINTFLKEEFVRLGKKEAKKVKANQEEENTNNNLKKKIDKLEMEKFQENQVSIREDLDFEIEQKNIDKKNKKIQDKLNKSSKKNVDKCSSNAALSDNDSNQNDNNIINTNTNNQSIKNSINNSVKQSANNNKDDKNNVQTSTSLLSHQYLKSNIDLGFIDDLSISVSSENKNQNNDNELEDDSSFDISHNDKSRSMSDSISQNNVDNNTNKKAKKNNNSKNNNELNHSILVNKKIAHETEDEEIIESNLNFQRPECSLQSILDHKINEKLKKKNEIVMNNFNIDNYIDNLGNSRQIKKKLQKRRSFLQFLRYDQDDLNIADMFSGLTIHKNNDNITNKEENEKVDLKNIQEKASENSSKDLDKEIIERNKNVYQEEVSVLSNSIKTLQNLSENNLEERKKNFVYDDDISLGELHKKEKLNKITSYAKKIFLDKKSKNSAANMNTNKMKKFYEKVNKQINENLIIDMKEPRGRNKDKVNVSHVYIDTPYEFNNDDPDFYSIEEDASQKVSIRNLLNSKFRRNYSILYHSSQNNTVQKDEDAKLKKEDKSEGVFKSTSVEKSGIKYPKMDTMKYLVQEENKKITDTLTTRQESISDNWKARRFYMNYLNNIIEKEIKVKDHFEIHQWKGEILGQEENIIPRKKLPESTEAEFVFNDKKLNIKRYKYLLYKLLEFEDDECAYITNDLKNLPFNCLEIMPIRMRDFGKYYVGKEINLGVLSSAGSDSKSATNLSNTATTINANYSASTNRSKSNFCSASSFGVGRRLKDDFKSKKLVYDKYYKSLDSFNYNTLTHYFLNEEKLYFKFIDQKHRDDRKKELEEQVKQKESAIEVKSEVRKVKIFDLNSNSSRYVQWSGGDVLYTKNMNSDECRDKYNDMISSVENFRVIIWIRAPGVKQIQKIKFGLYTLSISQIFDLIIMGLVLANAVVMALDGNLFTPEKYNDISISNYVFNGIFIAEFLIKLFGLGPIVYFSDAFTYLDLVIIAFAIFDMATADTGTTDTIGSKKKLSSQLSFLRVFRIFRVLRLTKILRRMKSMRLIIVSIKKCLAEVSYIVLILIMFTVIFELLGMSLLNGNSRYQSFMIAFYTTFQILTKEGWNQIFYELYSLSVFSFFYYLIWIFLGNYVLFNLFISILLQSFSSNDNEDDDDLDDGEIIDKTFGLPDYLYKMKEFEKNQREKSITLRVKRSNNTEKMEIDSASASTSRIRASQSALSDTENPSSSSMYIDEDDDDENKKEVIKNESGVEKNMRQWKKIDELFKKNECESAFYFLSQTNPVRIWCMSFANSFAFETIILILILLSTIKLILDTILKGYIFVWTFDIVDLVFNMVFLFEMIIKVIGLGLILDEGTYLRDHWNKIDFIIVIVSLVDIKSLVDKYIKGNNSSSSSLNFIKVLRLLRTLRTLRIISHNVQLKCIITSLFDSILPICYALFIVVIVYFMFSIVGINLFYNLYHNCYVPGVDTVFKLADSKFSDYLLQYSIADEMPFITKFCVDRYNGLMDGSPKFDFKNILNSLVTSYVLSTKEGWNEIMNDYRIYNEFYGIFFIVYVIVVSYFFINIFTGIMFRYFNEAYSREQKISNEDKKAAKYYDFLNQILPADPEFAIYQQPKQGTLDYYLVSIANSKFLDNFIMLIIFLNMIVMAINYDGTTTSYQSLLDTLNLIFTCIFIAECVLKLWALGLYCYFYVGWNDFDFFVVVASIVDLAVSNMSNINASFLKSFQIIRVLRVLRITRVLRLIKSLKSLEKLIQTLRWSIEALANVAVLMFILFLIFSILGCYLYESITYDEYKDDLYYLDSYYNFDNFYNSFLLVFRCSTGEQWSSIMREICLIDVDVVTEAQGYAYMIIVNFFSAIIMLNLFLMITLQQYDEFTSKSYNPVELFETFMENFKIVWNKLSTSQDNGRRISKVLVTDFFMEFQWKKLNFPEENKIVYVKKYISELKLREDPEGFIYFHDVLFKIIAMQMGGKIDRNLQSNAKLLREEKKIAEQVKKKINKYIDNVLEKIKIKGNKTMYYGIFFNPQTSYLYFKMSYIYMKHYIGYYKEYLSNEDNNKNNNNNNNINNKNSININNDDKKSINYSSSKHVVISSKGDYSEKNPSKFKKVIGNYENNIFYTEGSNNLNSSKVNMK